METIAIYWEPLVKTYGIDVESGVCLLTAALAADELAAFGGDLLSAFQPPGKVMMVSATPADADRILVHCVTSKRPSEKERMSVRPPMDAIDGVDLVYFHGPHYGDRYGIAAAALRALSEHNVPALSFACSGASVYIVVAGGTADSACQALSTAFIVPTRESSRLHP
jgi:hypothetical protein